MAFIFSLSTTHVCKNIKNNKVFGVSVLDYNFSLILKWLLSDRKSSKLKAKWNKLTKCKTSHKNSH